MKDHERLTRQAMRAFNEQDVDRWLAALHSECRIEFIGGFDGVIGEPFEGQEGARRFFEDWFAAFENMHVAVEGALEADERLVILHKLTGMGKGSGVPVELGGAAIYSFRDHKISRAAFYYDRDEALEAAGLQE